MSEDGNSGVLRGKPDRNGSHMAVGIVEIMLVGPCRPPPVLRLPVPPISHDVYKVGVIREKGQNRIRLVFVPSFAEVRYDLTDGLFITCSVNGSSGRHSRCHQKFPKD
jgi:hypothetical protein